MEIVLHRVLMVVYRSQEIVKVMGHRRDIIRERSVSKKKKKRGIRRIIVEVS